MRQKIRINLLLIAIAAVLMVGFMAFHLAGRIHGTGTTTATTGTISVAKAPAGAPTIRVLFYGNSYTFVNDLPHVIANIAASDTANPVDIETGMIAQGNIHLTELWQQQNARDALTAVHWDYVVLQEHSMETTTPEFAQAMHQALINWNAAITRSGAKTIIFETWARKPGSQWYTNPLTPSLHFPSAEAMQDQIDKITNAFAAEIHAPVIPIGDYIMACKDQPSMPQLYNPDGTHASPAGTYLAALAFYRRLTGHSLDHVTYVPAGVSAEDAAIILKCAAF